MFAMFATNCPRCSGRLERKPASFFKKRPESDRTAESAKPLPEAPG
jgi:hypothetical protein